MSRVLALSSWVAEGHVGLSAAVPVLQALGHSVTQLPTVILSNHPGFGNVAGSRVPPEQTVAMLDAMEANGWLGSHDAMLTGYLPSPEHVAVAVQTVMRLRALNPGLRVVVDPILGDAPKGLYVAEEAAEAVRDSLIPLADVLTPNLFELGWLTGVDPSTLAGASVAARSLPSEVLVTSAPIGSGRTGILRTERAAQQIWSTILRDRVPNGVGDVFSALIAAGYDTGVALGYLDCLIGNSIGAPHLRIVETASHWTAAEAILPAP